MAEQVESIKWVPNTRFLVDGFRFQSPRCSSYFLSHMHGDHYCGVRGLPVTVPPALCVLLLSAVAHVATRAARGQLLQRLGRSRGQSTALPHLPAPLNRFERRLTALQTSV